MSIMPTDSSFKNWSAYFDAQDSSKGLPLAFSETASKMHTLAHILIGFAVTFILATTISGLAYYQGHIATTANNIFFTTSYVVSFAIGSCLLYLAKRYLERDYEADPAFRKQRRDVYLNELLKNGLFAAETRYSQQIADANGKFHPNNYQTYSQHYFEHGEKDIADMLAAPAFNDKFKTLCERPKYTILDQVRMHNIEAIKKAVCEKRNIQKPASQNWVDFSMSTA